MAVSEILAAIPVIGKAIDFIKWAFTNIGRGVKLIAWKWTLEKLLKKKEEITNAESPSDWTDLANS